MESLHRYSVIAGESLIIATALVAGATAIVWTYDLLHLHFIRSFRHAFKYSFDETSSNSTQCYKLCCRVRDLETKQNLKHYDCSDWHDHLK